MSDTPKFEVIDRRKMKKDEEQEGPSSPDTSSQAKPAPEPAQKSAGPRLVEPEEARPPQQEPPSLGPEDELAAEMPPLPSEEEMREQESAYEASAQRVEDLLRAQNPTMGAQPPIKFEHLVQQLYLSALMQMGAATPEGQRPRVDIIGARQSIDLLGVLDEKTKGNLTDVEARMLETVLFELRMTFLELSKMISLQGMQAPPPKPEKH
ncbi:DUF1844 domain-containing protein [Occallatibacter savannae]|uniref:DUF1844 domain-containing protein n=1 Tax=Occallatibacter savannae TaxID=1002691 RepID=UPI000D69A3A2|nr:DUF1844 domain-containing protein [Occallatibacter savannae]